MVRTDPSDRAEAAAGRELRDARARRVRAAAEVASMITLLLSLSIWWYSYILR
jgi:hypothetical protein